MTKDDALLTALGDEAKARDAEDDRWWEAVESKDASALPSKDPADLDALRPLDEAEMDGIAAMLLAQAPAVDDSPRPGQGEGAKVIDSPKPGQGEGVQVIGSAKPGQGEGAQVIDSPKPGRGEGAKVIDSPKPGQDEGGQVIDSPKPGQDEGAKVISIFSARRWAVPFGAIAAAAAVALFMVRPPVDGGGQFPNYSLEVRSGEKPSRGPDDGQPQVGVTLYSDGALFDFVLVPDTSVTAQDNVALRAVIVDASGGAKAWDAASERLEGGTLRVRGQIGRDLRLEPGAYQLVFLVGAPSGLPKDPTTAAQAPPAGVQRFVAPIEIR